jgi:uncharacterized protein (TIGR00369 family)
MGVRVVALSDDWRALRVLLPLNEQNRNPGGSMFGGAVAALADPIPALACNRLFPGHAVWTRSLQVEFLRPGIADLELRFSFQAAVEEQVHKELQSKGRSNPLFEFGFYLPDGELSAWVSNRVAIRPMGESFDRQGALGDAATMNNE